MCRVRVSAKEPVKDLDSEGLLWVRSPVLCPDTFSGGRSTPTQQRLPSTLPPKQLAAAKQQGLALPRRLWAGLSAQVFHWRRTVLRLRLFIYLFIYFANYLFHTDLCEIVISNNNISQANSMRDNVS